MEGHIQAGTLAQGHTALGEHKMGHTARRERMEEGALVLVEVVRILLVVHNLLEA